MKAIWSDDLDSSLSDDEKHVAKCVSWQLKVIMR
jgi:hypothetical protein